MRGIIVEQVKVHLGYGQVHLDDVESRVVATKLHK